jgi:hypothetical protein
MAKTWRRLPAKTRLRQVDEQANCVVHLQVTDTNHADTPSSESIEAWRVISKQILLRP